VTTTTANLKGGRGSVRNGDEGRKMSLSLLVAAELGGGRWLVDLEMSMAGRGWQGTKTQRGIMIVSAWGMLPWRDRGLLVRRRNAGVDRGFKKTTAGLVRVRARAVPGR
jgi:hypothetical protein